MQKQGSGTTVIPRSPYYWGTVLVLVAIFAIAGWTFGLLLLVLAISVGTVVDLVVARRRA